MTLLQASILAKTPPLLSLPHHNHRNYHHNHHSKSAHVTLLRFNSSQPLPTFKKSLFVTYPSRVSSLLVRFALNPESFGSDSTSSGSDEGLNSVVGGENSSLGGENLVIEEVGSVKSDERLNLEGKVNGVEVKNEGTEVGKEREEVDARFPVLGLLVGLWRGMNKEAEKVSNSKAAKGFWNWLKESRLERLLKEADANPSDVSKQTALLVELGKHSPDAVIKRFEDKKYTVDSKGIVEYLRALVATNAISQYLPNEKKGKPSGLLTLFQELKQRASGNIDEALLTPGISDRQPLHVVMVDPKQRSIASIFVEDLLSTTIIMAVVLGFIWVMACGGLEKYMGGLNSGGKSSSVASSSSHLPKDSNKEIKPEKNVKTFKDVKGCDEAKQELEEVVEYLKNPAKFTRLGGKLPKGILLTGAPGTGKTLLAKAIAGEAGVPFFYRAGSEFEEMFVGVGARRVRSLFQAAKKKAPCIIFIDEIDAVGSTRKQWEGHTKKTLHQLLVEMDGFEQNEGIILMAATNLPDILDPALTRPGRFDRHIVVPSPDVRGRQEILELYLNDKPVADDVDVKAIARGTPGFNGADLANLVNIAAIKAAVEGAEQLTSAQLEFAKDRILMGTERKTMFISEENKKLTAYHESGHAIVALNTEGAHPIHKATIMPRGSALGMVTQLPSSDETSVSKKQLLARLDVCMGGRVAEEMIFGQDHVTTGASSDLTTATKLAKYMVTSCGMSDTIGPVHVSSKAGSVLQKRVDDEVRKLLTDAYQRVKDLLKKHQKELHVLASALLERETLTAEDIKTILLPFQEKPPAEEQEQEPEPSLEEQEQREEVELVMA